MGYATINGVEAAQYVPLAAQFENVAGGAIAVKDAVTVSPGQASNTKTAADQIWRWNTQTASWTYYFLCLDKRAGIMNQWVKDGDKVETTDTIPAGETFFFKRSSAATQPASLTLAGGVMDMSKSVSFSVTGAQLAFIANPWPIELPIKDFAKFVTGGEPKGSNTKTAADQIWFWNTETSTWTYYFLCLDKRAGIENLWVKDGEKAETADKIPVGKGIFFKRSSAASETVPLVVTITAGK